MYSDDKFSVWMPLIGFDVNQPDRGVREYLDRVGAKPQSILLFVFSADFIYQHEGMEREIVFSREYCNYYGAQRNDIREIQSWTNYALRDLVKNLKAEGIEVYLSIMGNHWTEEDVKKCRPNAFGFKPHQKFLEEHEELCMEGALWTANTYLLKRFKDGTYFSDYLAKKYVEVLKDYGADGIHLGDALLPPNMQLQEADMSFDMMERFEKYLGYDLPYGMTEFKADSPYSDIKFRAEYVWTNLRIEWITFVSECWQAFIETVCGALHKNGMKLISCNAWTSEPFEAIYRYGINYAKLAKGGIDGFCMEQQATGMLATGAFGGAYFDWELYCTSMLTRAYAEGPQYWSMNSLKDSAEDYAIFTHLPAALEKEIHSYSNYFLFDGEKMCRASDGYLICLGDSLLPHEWKRLIGHYEQVYQEEPVDLLGPVIGWSDRQIDEFLPEYIRTRRWSAHRLLANVNRAGGGVMGLCPISKLDKVNKDVFVPNVDLLTDKEIDKLLALPVTVVMTSIRGKEEKLTKLKNLPKFYDESAYQDECQSVAFVKCANPEIDVEAIFKSIDFTEKLAREDVDLSNVEDISQWMLGMVFRKVSGGFTKFLGKVLRTVSEARYGVSLPIEFCYALMQMPSGKKRIQIVNPEMLQYLVAPVTVKGGIAKVENLLNFPAQLIRLVMPDGGMSIQDEAGEKMKEAVGFAVKLPPMGAGIVDFESKD